MDIDERTSIANKLLEMHQTLESWEKVGQFYGLNKTTVWRIAVTDYWPKDPAILHKLGHPTKEVLIRERGPDGRWLPSLKEKT